MSLILLVDDDQHIRDVMGFALKKQGYEVIEADNGRAGLELLHVHDVDLVILDIMMPGLDGTEVCKEIRKGSDVPIVFASAMSDEVDMIVGLEIGGDDYICKPFSPRQLVARVKAILRRVNSQSSSKNNHTNADKCDEGKELKIGGLHINLESYKVYWQDEEVILTMTELSLLETLANRPTKVFSREELMQRAYDGVIVSDRTIDSHIRRVRHKFSVLGITIIETVHGAGYTLSEEIQS